MVYVDEGLALGPDLGDFVDDLILAMYDESRLTINNGYLFYYINSLLLNSMNYMIMVEFRFSFIIKGLPVAISTMDRLMKFSTRA